MNRTIVALEYSLIDQLICFFGIPPNLLRKPLAALNVLNPSKEVSIPSHTYRFGLDIVVPLVNLFTTFYKFHQLTCIKNDNVAHTDLDKYTTQILSDHKKNSYDSLKNIIEEIITSKTYTRLIDFLETFYQDYKLWYNFTSIKNLIKWIQNTSSNSFFTKKTSKFKPSTLRTNNSRVTSENQLNSSLPNDEPLLSNIPTENDPQDTSTSEPTNFPESHSLLVLDIVLTHIFVVLMLNIPRQFFSSLTLKNSWSNFLPSGKNAQTFIDVLKGILSKPFYQQDLTEKDKDCFYDSFQDIFNSIPESGTLKNDDVRLLKYFIGLIRTWDTQWIPVISYLKMLINNFNLANLSKEEINLVPVGLKKTLTKSLSNLKELKGTYCGEMGVWMNLVYNFNITFQTLKEEKITDNNKIISSKLIIHKQQFESPIKYIKSDYQHDAISCIDFLDIARIYLQNNLPYPELIASFKHAFYYIPFFDEALAKVTELSYAYFKNNPKIKDDFTYLDSIEILNSDKISKSIYNKLSDKAKILHFWITSKQWLKTTVFGFNELFWIKNGVCLLDPLPNIHLHTVFWAFMYCIHRLCFTTTMLRTDLFCTYQNVFNVKSIRKKGIYTWEKQISTVYLSLGDFYEDYGKSQKSYEFNLDTIFDDRLDLNLQKYLTCFLDMADWFFEFLRPNTEHSFNRKHRIEIMDDHIPLYSVLFPHPSKDIAHNGFLDIGNLIQHMRLWHDTPSNYLAVIMCFEKAISCRNKKRSIGKKLYDCCEESYGMTSYVNNMIMLILMGLVSRQYLLHFKKKHYGLPIIYRPNFATVYWLWRLFFDRKFSDSIYRYNYKSCEGKLKYHANKDNNSNENINGINTNNNSSVTDSFSSNINNIQKQKSTNDVDINNDSVIITDVEDDEEEKERKKKEASSEHQGNQFSANKFKKTTIFQYEQNLQNVAIPKYSPYTAPMTNTRGKRGVLRGRGRGKNGQSTRSANLKANKTNIFYNESDERIWSDSEVSNDPRLFAFYPRINDFPASFQTRQKIFEAKKDEQFVKILLCEELNFREIVYKNREDALIPIMNDLLLSFLHQESDLVNDVIKEFLVQYLSSQPQFWQKPVSSDEYNELQYADNMIETRWKTYFIKTTILNNIVRFNLDTCIYSILNHIIETEFYKKIKPWELDTIISCGIRTINNQNKMMRQFSNFFDNNVYTFRKASIVSAIHTQLDTFMEGILKKSISLEQEIYDLQYVVDSLLPSIHKLQTIELTDPLQKSLLREMKNAVVELLIKNGIQNTSLQIHNVLNNNSKILMLKAHISNSILKERRSKHKYYNKPLNDELRHYIWNTIFKYSTPENPYDPSVLGRQLMESKSDDMIRYIFHDILTGFERDFLFKIIKLEEDQVSSKKINKLMSLLSNAIPSLKKIHFIMETIYTAYSLQSVPLDYESTKTIHETMIRNRFQIIPGMPVNYKDIYRAVITMCCNRIASLGKNNTLYGHFYISHDPTTGMLICNKKKSKKMNYNLLLSSNTSSPTSAKHTAHGSNEKTTNNKQLANIGKPSSSANSTPHSSSSNLSRIRLTDDDYQIYLDSEMNISQFATNLNSNQHFQTQNDKIISQEILLPTQKASDNDFFFTYILESNKMGKILVKQPSLNIINAVFSSTGVSEDDINIYIQQLKEYITTKRFNLWEDKEQNKFARRLKKIRHPDCINNPPVICVDIFAKRIFYGRDEKNRKIYQSCLKCGNLTSYQDENWTHDYACFNCWLKDFYIHTRCTYCHVIHHKVFSNAHVDIATGSSTSNQASDELLKKERAKRIVDILKSQRRDKVKNECMWVPTFPICLSGISTEQKRKTMTKTLGMAMTVILEMENKELWHSILYSGLKNRLTELPFSRMYVERPFYFSAYFCPAHKPLNPNIINQNVGEPFSHYNKANFNALSNVGAIRTFITNSFNFNVNNQYRISFVPEFFKVLQKKKEKKKK